ncbi:HAMP domain-containing protein [bacterium]|nr:HAMP domain-containing protein [bacterium]
MKINFSLSLKLTLIVFSVSAIVFASLTYINVQEQASFFEDSYSEKATALAQALDASIGSRSQLEDEQQLYNYILKFMFLNPDIEKISISLPDEFGILKVVVSSDANYVGELSSDANYISYEEDAVINIPIHDGDSHTLTVVTPLHLSGQRVGTYEMSLTMDDAYAALNLRVMNFVTISAFGLFLLVVSFLYLLRRIIIKPIATFRDVAIMVGEGNLDTEIKFKARDELGDLALAFNDMVNDLKKSRVEIEEYSKTLEKRVDGRTKELAVSKDELRQKVDALEKNKKAMMNIMWDLKKTIGALENAEKQIKEQNIDLKTAQKELHVLNMDLEDKVKERTAEVGALLKQKDEFIGQLGHDLKNPLTPLVGLLPILEEREKDPNVKEHFRVVLRNVDYMRDIVFKTLQLARLRSPNTQFDVQDVDLRAEFDNVIANQKLFFQENHMDVENVVGEGIIVQADKLRLDELISNLFTNAVKYSPEDGGKITVDAKKNGGFIIISVRDTGIGMTEEQIKHIFDEFYKADKSRHDMDSSGLGLAISKRIVEKHGGKIWAESQGPGKGSIFYFTLKLDQKTIKNVEIV